MHPPRGCRQSNLRSAVAQKGPARHLTCWRAPGAGLRHPFSPAQIERGPNTPYRLILVINSYYELHPPKERYVPLWILRHSQHPTQSLCVGTIKAPGRRRATIKLNVVTRIGLRLDRPLTRRSRRKLEYPLSL